MALYKLSVCDRPDDLQPLRSRSSTSDIVSTASSLARLRLDLLRDFAVTVSLRKNVTRVRECIFRHFFTCTSATKNGTRITRYES